MSESGAHAGWVGLSPDLRLIGESFGHPSSLTVSFGPSKTGRWTDHKGRAAEDGGMRFRKSLRDLGPTVQVLAGGQALIGSGRTLTPHFDLDGRSTEDKGRIAGWVRLGWCPTAPTTVELRDDFGNTVQARTRPQAGGPQRRVFESDVRRFQGGRIWISALLPDGARAPLPDSPLLLNRSLVRVGSAGASRKRSAAAGGAKIGKRRAVDVIVPAYLGLDETATCIRSVLDSVGEEAELVVIDDASPDPQLRAHLDQLAAASEITLVRNDTNVGFTGSVNRGMSLHSDRDVVLLNSDAVVFGDWLARMQAVAYRENGTGTVTPWSNDGSLVSYPSKATQLDVPAAAELDRLAARLFAGRSREIPVGVGFCLYIRRDCLTETGPFDEAAFTSGYGEETDFCMRARSKGWSHHLATNVFVLHSGGRSFGQRRRALLERSSRIVNLRYPGYDRWIAKFLHSDPLHPLRKAIDEHRLAFAEGERFVLIVTLALGGGVGRFVAERKQALLASGRVPLVLSPSAPDSKSCSLHHEGSPLPDLRYDAPSDLKSLTSLLGKLPIEHIELHHFLGLGPGVVEAVLSLRAPYDVYVHDYIWICPRVTLIDHRGRYCGEPPIAQCEVCLERNGSRIDAPTSVSALRHRSGRWLAAARQVYVPSEDVSLRMQRYFPNVRMTVTPWETAVQPRPAPVSISTGIRVVSIGAVGRQKGYKVLLACARDAVSRKLPIEFVVIGYTEDDAPLTETGQVFVTGRYKDAEVSHLIDREQPKVAFFSSVWPETWCYALSHAIAAGLPIVAFDLGTIAERLRKVPGATLLPLNTRPAVINDTLIRLAALPAQATNYFGNPISIQNKRTMPSALSHFS